MQDFKNDIKYGGKDFSRRMEGGRWRKARSAGKDGTKWVEES
jgi:hypothetical protein